MNPELETGGEEGRVEVGRYLRRDQAEDRALVVLAMGLPYWIVPGEGLYALWVEAGDAPAIFAELQNYEAERRAERRQAGREKHRALPLTPPGRPVSRFSLHVYGWLMGLSFLVQGRVPREWHWMARGAADSQAILHGELWRVLTALTLHANLGHLLANLLVGLLFAGALLPWLGAGWTWLGIVLSGAAGNWLNAWVFRDAPHSSIGASTAVFGGLGMLVGWQILSTLRHTGRTPRLREILFPIGAGFALLAYLGTGGEGERVDVTAHLFGMLSGFGIGLALAWGDWPRRTPPAVQAALALAAVALPILGWLFAYCA